MEGDVIAGIESDHDTELRMLDQADQASLAPAAIESLACPRGGARCRQCSQYSFLIPTVTHNFIGSSTAPRYVPDFSHSRNFFSLPSDLPSCPQFVPKADQERPSQTPARLSVEIVPVNWRYTCYPSGSSSRIRQISWR
jgi:hypothetical protein